MLLHECENTFKKILPKVELPSQRVIATLTEFAQLSFTLPPVMQGFSLNFANAGYQNVLIFANMIDEKW